MAVFTLFGGLLFNLRYFWVRVAVVLISFCRMEGIWKRCEGEEKGEAHPSRCHMLMMNNISLRRSLVWA